MVWFVGIIIDIRVFVTAKFPNSSRHGILTFLL